MSEQDEALATLAEVTGLSIEEVERAIAPAPTWQWRYPLERSGITPGGIAWRG